jgi:hypothetical protein
MMSFTAIRVFLKGLSPLSWALIAIAALLFLWGSVTAISAVNRHFEGNAEQRAQNTDIKARETASEKREQDNKVLDQKQDNLSDAIEPIPDQPPSPIRLAVACQRLCNDGRKQLPASCGPQARCEAGTRRYLSGE